MASQNKWSEEEATKLIEKYKKDGISEDLALRTYSARLLGSDPELVLHGGGNTSVKSTFVDLVGNMKKVLHVKGSGWDLETIEPARHTAVNLEPLIKLRKLKALFCE